jgi:hypothetical protein
MRVMTDLGDIRRTKRGSIIGRIWFADAGNAFPEARWLDFIVVLLGWWMQQLLELREARTDHLDFLFMDGPYRILAKPTGDDSLALSFRKSEEPAPLMPVTISTGLHDLEADVLTTARAVVDACRRQEWSDDAEVQKLARLADELALVLDGGQVSLRPPSPSREEVENQLLDLIGGAISREDASTWAEQWASDDEVEVDEGIWEALRRLHAADIPTTDRPYLYERIDFESWLSDLRRHTK